MALLVPASDTLLTDDIITLSIIEGKWHEIIITTVSVIN